MTGVQTCALPISLVALLGGEVHVGILGVDVVEAHVRSGRLRALGVTAAQRLAGMPELPTLAERGISGYEFSSWYGVLAPAATPAPVIDALNSHLVRALANPELAARLSRDGTRIVASTPAAFGAHLKAEIARWRGVVRAAGLRTD